MGTRCPDHVTPLYPQKLALTSPTGGGRSVGIVRSRTKATEFGVLVACIRFSKLSSARVVLHLLPVGPIIMAIRFVVLASMMNREGKKSVNSFSKNWNFGKTARGVNRNGFWEEQSAICATKCRTNRVAARIVCGTGWVNNRNRHWG